MAPTHTIQDGDHEYIEWLYKHHWARFVSTAERALTDCARMYAEDLVADVMLDVECGRFGVLLGTCADPPSFIGGVIRHRARHLNRREMRVVSLPNDVLDPATCEAWSRAAQILLARDVSGALRHLTPRQREVASMHWLDQWSTPQIAGALGISVCTVKELLRRAALRLRDQLAQYADEKG
jgi:RNA polymerase sigma factor (sigma-70 family)